VDGYEGLSASELRILLHLISRVKWGNKIWHTQTWLAQDLGMTPQAYCRGLATLERFDFVRKRPTNNNPRVIQYLMLNPILVQIGNSKDAEQLWQDYREMPGEKVVSAMPIRVAKSAAQSASGDDPGPKPRSAPLTIPIQKPLPVATVPKSVGHSEESQNELSPADPAGDVDLGR
jgi:hypothetical protein